METPQHSSSDHVGSFFVLYDVFTCCYSLVYFSLSKFSINPFNLNFFFPFISKCSSALPGISPHWVDCIFITENQQLGIRIEHEFLRQEAETAMQQKILISRLTTSINPSRIAFIAIRIDTSSISSDHSVPFVRSSVPNTLPYPTRRLWGRVG